MFSGDMFSSGALSELVERGKRKANTLSGQLTKKIEDLGIAPGLASQQTTVPSSKGSDEPGLEASSSLLQQPSMEDGVYRPIPGTALVAKFEERRQLLTARRVKISERAAHAEEALGKAASECRYHSETLRQFHSEFAHLPRLTQAVHVLKGDLQQSLQLCNQLEMAYTDVTEGKVLVGLEKWRDEEWAKMKHYEASKMRELEHLEAQVLQKQQQVEQKKAARAGLRSKPAGLPVATPTGTPTVTSEEGGGTGSDGEEAGVGAAQEQIVVAKAEVEEEEEDGEDYYVTSPPQVDATGDVDAAKLEATVFEEADGDGETHARPEPIEAVPPTMPDAGAEGVPPALEAAPKVVPEGEPAPLVVEGKKKKKKKKR